MELPSDEELTAHMQASWRAAPREEFRDLIIEDPPFLNPQFLNQSPTELDTNFNMSRYLGGGGNDINQLIQGIQNQFNEIHAQQEATATRRNDTLEAILNELRVIRENSVAMRQDQVIIKEALLYAPGGPGADQARESFEAQQK